MSLSIAVAACGDGLSDSTPVVNATPTPRPGSTPTPTPTATPVATPTPTGLRCALATQPNCATENGPYEFGCCTARNIEELEPGYEAAINEAQDFVENTRPELFDANGKVRGGSERAYTQAVAARIVSKNGICTAAPSYMPEDEIAMKDRNEKSQIIDIIQGDGTRRLKYVSMCLPSNF